MDLLKSVGTTQSDINKVIFSNLSNYLDNDTLRLLIKTAGRMESLDQNILSNYQEELEYNWSFSR
jgi:hypothetical protein